ncbi:MAG: CPBP family intramembrane metalloprotease [Acidobacteria bacterium]|nr:CPBP family intramembrane metalloprotease [Acidobacteriota bacterium]
MEPSAAPDPGDREITDRQMPVGEGPAGEASPSCKPLTIPGPGSRLWALLEVILCTDLPAALLVQFAVILMGFRIEDIFHSSSLFAIIRLSSSALILGTIALFLSVRRERFWTLLGSGFQWRREALVGLAVVPVLFGATGLVGFFFRRFFPEMVTAENPILTLIKTPLDTLWLLLTAVLAGGLEEEIQRAFVLRRFEKYLGGISVGLVVWTVYFGAGHYVQGFDNAMGAGMLGLLFGLTYIWRQNLVAPVVAHAAYDSIVVLLYSAFGFK